MPLHLLITHFLTGARDHIEIILRWSNQGSYFLLQWGSSQLHNCILSLEKNAVRNRHARTARQKKNFQQKHRESHIMKCTGYTKSFAGLFFRLKLVLVAAEFKHDCPVCFLKYMKRPRLFTPRSQGFDDNDRVLN